MSPARSSPESRAAVLLPGDYLLELEMLRPVSRDTVENVLDQAGFRDLAFDSGFGGSDYPKRGAKIRATATLSGRALLAHVPDRIRWILVHRLRVARSGTFATAPEPAATSIGGGPGEVGVRPGETYEARLLAKNRAIPSRDRLWNDLRRMGYEPLKLVEVRCQMRLPNLPGSLWSEWLAWLRWRGPPQPAPQHPAISIEEVAVII